jgi:hypothetical protein
MLYGKNLIGRIYIEERPGTGWVPYKTLIGYGIGNRVLVASRGEQFYMEKEYRSQEAAIEAAKTRASAMIKSKFGDIEEIRWDVVEERQPGCTRADPFT